MFTTSQLKYLTIGFFSLALFASLRSEAAFQPCTETSEMLTTPTPEAFVNEACSLQGIPEIYAWIEGYINCRGDAAELLWNEKLRSVRRLQNEAKHGLAMNDPFAFLSTNSTDDEFKREAFDLMEYVVNTSPENFVLMRSYLASGYRKLNFALRNSPRAAQCIQPAVNLVKRALQKLPAYNGLLWRGVRIGATDRLAYRVGQVITWSTFSSASPSKEVASSFAGRNPHLVKSLDPNGVVFEIHSKSCRDTYPLKSRLVGELEAICPPGAKFKVLEVKGDSVVLDEIL